MAKDTPGWYPHWERLGQVTTLSLACIVFVSLLHIWPQYMI